MRLPHLNPQTQEFSITSKGKAKGRALGKSKKGAS